jgi:ubiquinone/menaquinone biosynthesis C-methylase UbiE
MKFKFSDLGKKLNVEVLRQLVDVAGKQVVDVGCGSLKFSKILADEGASVLAIDPDQHQAVLNHKDPPEPDAGITFVEAEADAIPASDKSQDAVFFCHSLHHIPADQYGVVAAEVQRVLKPDGFMYVIEPVDGPLNDVMRMFHDEETERTAAWRFLEQFADFFEFVNAVKYHSISTFEDWNAFVNNYGNRSFNSDYRKEDVCRDEVRLTFERKATRTNEGYLFPANKHAVCFKNLKM